MTFTPADRSPKHPKETLQRALLSSTSYFTGEYEDEGILITHAFPGMRDRHAMQKMMEGPLSRSAFIASFDTSPPGRSLGVVLPDYTWVGDTLAAFLSVLYGKRFDNHGMIEMLGRFALPDMSSLAGVNNSLLAHNSHEVRTNFPIKLELMQFRRIVSFFSLRHLNEKFSVSFEGACSFYARALRLCETDPEVAYLHLITAGEILSAYFERTPDELFDESTKQAMRTIEAIVPDGERISSLLKGRLLQVKRRFVLAFSELVDESFFENPEQRTGIGTIQVAEFKTAIGAAYDLRSKFVHTGANFGGWVAPRSDRVDVFGGVPSLADRELAKTISKAPTFNGLERIVRYALLRFAGTAGREIFPNLLVE
ncbi:HEPN domain-containing protein [Paraburkholderia dipogonis]|uniref:HEPN domain-containing protein n=1 Tax=Paraburkholderia dipogonis TaxID=1211383 RepID=A0ABW9AS09_9BURK